MAENPGERDARRSYPLAAQVGVSGLRNNYGYIREEFLPELTGRRGREIYHEMASNDATVGAILYAITMLLRSVAWNFAPADPENERAVESAEMVEGMLTSDMLHSWPEVVDTICSMFTYGFCVLEVLWKKRDGPKPGRPWMGSEFDDGYWAPRALASRSQRTIERWIFDDQENLLGFEQLPWNGPLVTVPITRCLHFRTTVTLDNPEGNSVLRTSYRSWYFLKRLQEIEGIGVERDLAGYPVLRVPKDILVGTDPNAAAAKASYEKLLRSVRRDQQEGVMLPSDRDEKGNLFYEFELMSAGGSRQLQIDVSIQRYQKDIARSVLADFIFLGADGGGSLALGKTKVQTFVLAMQGYLSHIAAVVNETLIPAIWAVNGFDPELMPKAEPADVAEEDLEGLAKYLTALSGVGYDLASDTELENVLRAKADLPPAPERNEEDFAPLVLPGAAGSARVVEEPGAVATEREEMQATEETAAKRFMAALLEGFDDAGR